MKHAVYLPPFGELSDVRALADLAVAAEQAGWDAVFLWDHLLRPPTEPTDIADAWTALAAVAYATTSIRIGPMVTPLPRRRPQKLAKEIATVDRLSAGRLTVGLGLGHDGAGELSRFGDEVDGRRRGDMLDEGAALLAGLLSGETISHAGSHYQANEVRFLPTPAQRPRPPIWFAARGGNRRPVRRAASYEGLFPIEVDPDGVGRMAEWVEAERGSLDGFDIAVAVIPGVDLDAFAARGATWAMWAFIPGQTIADVEAFVAAGPQQVS